LNITLFSDIITYIKKNKDAIITSLKDEERFFSSRYASTNDIINQYVPRLDDKILPTIIIFKKEFGYDINKYMLNLYAFNYTEYLRAKRAIFDINLNLLTAVLRRLNKKQLLEKYHNNKFAIIRRILFTLDELTAKEKKSMEPSNIRMIVTRINS
jgi:hypothetical protein